MVKELKLFVGTRYVSIRTLLRIGRPATDVALEYRGLGLLCDVHHLPVPIYRIRAQVRTSEFSRRHYSPLGYHHAWNGLCQVVD